MSTDNHLELVDATLALLDAAIAQPDALGALLAADIAQQWEGFPEALPVLRRACAADPGSAWGTILFVVDDPRTLVGMGGYKGPPSAQGVVEIGYSIAPAWRDRGLATRAARALLARALADERVKAVDAHTLGQTSASTRVLEKLGMRRVAELSDPDHGPIWHWRLTRDHS